MKVLVVFCVSSILINFVTSSKVLMVLPLGSRSHKNIFTPLAETLATDGHEVILASMYGNSNNFTLPYKDIEARKASDTMKRLMGEFDIFKMMEMKKNVNSEVMKKVITHLPEFCDAFIKDPALKVIWNFRPDLILLPAFMNECGLVFVQKFKVPFIYVTTSGLTPWTSELAGSPEHPAYVPNQYLPFTDDMNLFQRTVNSVFRLLTPYLRRRFVLDRLDVVAQKFLKDSSVSLAEIERNVSLVLVNSHHSLGFPRPLTPNVIEVGGMHCRDPEPIVDEELNQFLRESEDNSVILFSLGSHIQSSQLPTTYRDLFIRAFARLPYKVIWKWEGPQLSNLSSNVLLKKWIPQQDLLGHRAIGGFLSHGGLLSSQEAVYHSVPIVGLPLMSDQHLNVKQAATIGVAIELNFATLTEDEVVDALTRIMKEKTFREAVHGRSMVMRDQETKPVDRATYFAEYVIRHKGAQHLKPASASLSYANYLLLDVIAVLTVIIIVSVLVIICLCLALYYIAKLVSTKCYSYLLAQSRKGTSYFIAHLHHLTQDN